jgi:hypothetical protein
MLCTRTPFAVIVLMLDGTPDLAFYNLEGSWEIENHGVAPDFEVEMDPEFLKS